MPLDDDELCLVQVGVSAQRRKLAATPPLGQPQHGELTELGKSSPAPVKNQTAPLNNTKRKFSVGQPVPSINSTTQFEELGGSSKELVNWMVVAVLGGMLVIVGTAVLLGALCPFLKPSNGRPPLWVLAMIVASYGILIPGIFATSVSFNIGFKIPSSIVDSHQAKSIIAQYPNASAMQSAGFSVIPLSDGKEQLVFNVLTDPSDNSKIQPMRESMWGFVGVLWETGGWAAAVLLILYAMVIPLVKISLFLIGEVLRNSDSVSKRKVARGCIIAVQYVSKWACPDMFAYILLLYLFRDLSDELIDAPAVLDIGFVFYTVFCIFSTFSSLAMTLPEVPPAEEKEEKKDDCCNSTGPVQAAILGALAVGLLALGAFTPCMSLAIGMDHMYEDQGGPIPTSLKPIVKSLNIEKHINSSTSLWDCTKALWAWSSTEKELICILAFIMLGVFCLVLPILSVLTNVVLACNLRNGGEADAKRKSLFRTAKVLKHMSMLDVCCMGVVVIVLAGSMYSSFGVIFRIEGGLTALVASEIVHLILYLSMADEVGLSDEV